jgi:hypothetical protein
LQERIELRQKLRNEPDEKKRLNWTTVMMKTKKMKMMKRILIRMKVNQRMMVQLPKLTVRERRKKIFG